MKRAAPSEYVSNISARLVSVCSATGRSHGFDQGCIPQLRNPSPSRHHSHGIVFSTMRALLICVLLGLCSLLASAGHSGSRAEYVGGTRADIPSNNGGEIRVTDPIYFVFLSKHTQV